MVCTPLIPARETEAGFLVNSRPTWSTRWLPTEQRIIKIKTNRKQSLSSLQGSSWQHSWFLLQVPALTFLTDELWPDVWSLKLFLPLHCLSSGTYHSYRKKLEHKPTGLSTWGWNENPCSSLTICGVCSKADTTGYLPVSWDRIKPFAYCVFILYIQTNDKD